MTEQQKRRYAYSSNIIWNLSSIIWNDRAKKSATFGVTVHTWLYYKCYRTCYRHTFCTWKQIALEALHAAETPLLLLRPQILLLLRPPSPIFFCCWDPQIILLLRPSDFSAAETTNSSAAETPQSHILLLLRPSDSSTAETQDSTAAETPTSQWRVLLRPLRATDTQPPVRPCVMCVSAAETPVPTIHKAPSTGKISRRFLDRLYIDREIIHSYLSYGPSGPMHRPTS